MLSKKALLRHRLNKYQRLVNLHASRAKEAETKLEKSKRAILRLANKMLQPYLK